MKRLIFRFSLVLLAVVLLSGCFGSRKVPSAVVDDGQIEVVILHINDVYEIAPLSGGKVGGMARVEALKEKLEAENPNLLFVHAGDFLSPSLIGTLKVDGERIKGKQMIEVMNAMDVDLVTFGNHEFDLDEDELQQRLDESDFTWLGTNVRHIRDGEPQHFQMHNNGQTREAVDFYNWQIKDADGTEATIGFFSSTLPSNPRDYVYYGDPYKMAQEMAVALREKSDVVLGLTHLELEGDLKLASMVPFVPLLMGGHDHDNLIDTVGNTVVAKADANVKSVYVHRVKIDHNRDTYTVFSEWIPITDQMPSDSHIEAIVQKWNQIQDEVIGQIVANPDELVYVAAKPLDGRESSIRNKPTNLGKLIAEAMLAAASKGTEAAIFNSGSVRIDDQLHGDVVAIDLFRALPFGGGIVQVEMKGSLLEKVMDIGKTNKGTGGYLQYTGLEEKDGNWLLNGQAVLPSEVYQIAMPEFLLTGLETGLDFLTRDHPDILAVHGPEGMNEDIRKVVIHYMKTQ